MKQHQPVQQHTATRRTLAPTGHLQDRADASPGVQALHDLQSFADRGQPPVQREPDLTGSLRVFGDEKDVHTKEDPEFKGTYESTRSEEQRRTDEVIIAVLDTGIQTKDNVIGDQVKAAQDFARSQEQVAQGPYTPQSMVNDPHGSRVAGQAAYGTKKIKLLDARVQNIAMSKGSLDPAFPGAVARAIAWSVAQGASIITSSVVLPWEKPEVQAEINKHPTVYFLTTAGNDNKKFEEGDRSIDAGGDRRENALLVGGSTVGGKKHPKRGYGPGVDVMVPGAQDTSDRPNLNLLTPFPFLQSQFEMTDEQAETMRRDHPGVIDRLTSEDTGVSFGLPVVANTIAKMRLIHPGITPAQITDILVNHAVQEKGGELAETSRSGGMIDPAKAYAKAKELAEAG